MGLNSLKESATGPSLVTMKHLPFPPSGQATYGMLK